jgi:hypothetical protein
MGVGLPETFRDRAVDYATQARTIKDSGFAYAGFIRNGAASNGDRPFD